MDTEIIFNGQQFPDTFKLEEAINLLSPDYLKFTGSLVYNKGLNMHVFKCVNLKEIKYYIIEFNKINKNSEVKFEFQTDDGFTKKV